MFNPFEAEILTVHGPYVVGKNNPKVAPRRSMIFTLANGRTTSMSYARWLMTQHLGRVLGRNEHVDHVNDDPMDDRLDNYQILTPAENQRKARLGKPSPTRGVERGFTHGTLYAWQNKRCGCDPCLAAKREYRIARNERRRADHAANSRGPRGPYSTVREHGTSSEYRRGCRCDPCKAANALRQREYRERRVCPAGVEPANTDS